MTNKPTTPPQPEFVIRQLYVKDLSLECPQPPQAVQIPTEPQINLQFAMNSNTMPNQEYELVLHVTVTAKTDDKTLFLVEIKQAGLFLLNGFTEEQIHQILGITCPAIIFPYAHEAISSLIGRAGFPPLYLTPINFEALYAQKMQEQAQGQGDSTVEVGS